MTPPQRPKLCTCKQKHEDGSAGVAQRCEIQTPCSKNPCAFCNPNHPARSFTKADSILSLRARVNKLSHLLMINKIPRPVQIVAAAQADVKDVLLALQAKVRQLQLLLWNAGVAMPESLLGPLPPRHKLVDLPPEILHKIMGRAIAGTWPGTSYAARRYVNSTPRQLHYIEHHALVPARACAKLFEIGLKDFVKLQQPRLELNTTDWSNMPGLGEDERVQAYCNEVDFCAHQKDVIDSFVKMLPKSMLRQATAPSIIVHLGAWDHDRTHPTSSLKFDIEAHNSFVANASEFIDRLPQIFPRAQAVDIHFRFRSARMYSLGRTQSHQFQPVDLSKPSKEFDKVETRLQQDLADLVGKVIAFPGLKKQVSIEIRDAMIHLPGKKHDCRDQTAEEVVEELLGPIEHGADCDVTYWIDPDGYHEPMQSW